MVAQTGCDAVMIGRAAASNPWIFRQIAQHAAAGTYDEPTDRDRYEMIHTYFQMLVDEAMPGAAGKMKQFASWFTHGVPNGSLLRKAVYESRTEHDILARVDEFFAVALSEPAVPAH
jgi:tRNA-dihydrouridine synthase